jgi:hypothetical protein
MLDSSSHYSSTLKVEATCSYETSVDFQRTIWRYIPDDRTLRNHQCENLKSYKTVSFVSLSQHQVKVTTRHFRVKKVIG